MVEISLIDAHGTDNPTSDRTVTVEVQGPATLQGLGTARPATEESYLDSKCTTYEGTALAAVRPTGTAGTVVLTVKADGVEPATLSIDLQAVTGGAPAATRDPELAIR